MVLRHDDGDLTDVSLILSVIRDPGLTGLPSIFGRDVLSIGGFAMNAILERVQLDLPVGAFAV